MLPCALVLFFIPLGMLTDIRTITESGFSGQNIGVAFLGILGLIFGISMLVPVFRIIYSKLPWLYMYIQIFMINILILTIGIYLLNIGFEVQNQARHTVFFWLMIAVIVICRLAMSFYYKLKPIKVMED